MHAIWRLLVICNDVQQHDRAAPLVMGMPHAKLFLLALCLLHGSAERLGGTDLQADLYKTNWIYTGASTCSREDR